MIPMAGPHLKKFGSNESRMAQRLVFLKKVFVDSSDVQPRLSSIALEEFSDSPSGSLPSHVYISYTML